MSSNFDSIDLENSTTSTLFDFGWKIQQELANTPDQSSANFDQKRKKVIEVLQKCENMLGELGLFSKNESLEEVSSNELRYFINDALLGWLFSKTPSSRPSERLPALEESKKYYINYLTLTFNYGIHQIDIKQFGHSGQNADPHGFPETQYGRQAAFEQNLIKQAYDRSEKIKRYREQKELEEKLKDCQLVLAKPYVDEEQKSEIYNIYIKYWLNQAVDDLKLINDEISILSSVSKEPHEKVHKPVGATGGLPQTGKPYIITRDAIQAQVFGAGYPSVPVYSIEEFYDQLADKGFMPHCGQTADQPVQIGKGVTENQKQEEKAQKDLLEDRQDDEEIKKQREWDDFKDDNKRGSGNRYNRS
ncbi:immunoglobulin-binding 1 [Brachionus plicatilis]|uniref:Immunoglobulin-binding 1 n=1 Tax=Brachionus plicatilis TaxID=10195 RepID=A0A3M7PMK0_BRAPC|nr:immunoglobulin-binding 1 [Brachionus plicatilis]